MPGTPTLGAATRPGRSRGAAALAAAFDALGSGVLVLDPDGRPAYGNRAALDLLGPAAVLPGALATAGASALRRARAGHGDPDPCARLAVDAGIELRAEVLRGPADELLGLLARLRPTGAAAPGATGTDGEAGSNPHRRRAADDSLRALERELRRTAGELERLAARAAEASWPLPASPAAPTSLDGLSAREWEVARLVLAGHRVRSIAATLFISEHTVRNHLKAIFRKVGVTSQVELFDRLRSAPTLPSP